MSVISSIVHYVAPLAHSARAHRRENFPAMTCAEANDAQFEELLRCATREDLCDMVRDLRQRLRVAERAMSPRVLIGMCRND